MSNLVNIGRRLDVLKSTIEKINPNDMWIIIQLHPIFLQLVNTQTDPEQEKLLIKALNKKIDDYEWRFGKTFELAGRLIREVLQEAIIKDQVHCDGCGWKWKIVDGGDKPYICHKCGHDNTPTEDKVYKTVQAKVKPPVDWEKRDWQLYEQNKVKYLKPNFDAEWEEAVRYPEFNNMGKEQWIRKARVGGPIQYSKIKNVLGNVDLDFESLEEPKKQRFLAALQKGVIEMPIAVKFSNDDYDLVAGNTRLSGLIKNGIDPKIWIVDLSDMRENFADTTPDERTINENAAISFLINIIIRLGGAALYYFSDYIIDSLSRLIKPGNTVILLKRLKKNKQFYKELGELIKKDSTIYYNDFSEKLLSLPSAKKELEKLVKDKNLSDGDVSSIKSDIQLRFRRSFLDAAEAIKRQFPQGDQEVEENYADGKVKGKSRPGRVKKAGASCKGSVTDLQKRVNNASGEKRKMLQWCLNMKRGRKK